MTDIVFLLLIFFIIASTLISPYALEVDLPNASVKSKNKQLVSVTIKSDNSHYVNGESVSVEEIESILQSKLANREKPEIALNVDQSVETGVMVRILEIAKRNRYGIALVTESP